MAANPLVSVIIAVFNGQQFLASAMESVLFQTCQDFELIVVDDASTDGTPAILQRYAAYEKVKILHNAKNMERAYSRNLALEHARGDYVAILDADDVCLPTRLELQLRFMEQHPEIDVLGGKFLFIDDEGRQIEKQQVRLKTHSEIAWATLFSTPIAHSTALMRTARLKEVNGYDTRWPPCEDADLWIRMLKAGSKFHNLATPLTKYRTNARQRESFNLSLPKAKEIRRLFLEDLLEQDVSSDEYEFIFQAWSSKPDSPVSPGNFLSGFHKLYSAFLKMKCRGYLIYEDISHVEREILERLAEWINLLSISDKKIVLGSMSEFSSGDWLDLYVKQKKKYFAFGRSR